MCTYLFQKYKDHKIDAVSKYYNTPHLFSVLQSGLSKKKSKKKNLHQ